ncbi:B-cell antigen receptor complex-associated protein alpha chain [Tachysurus fulvidraco]|uniref:B-cell antigen receptor complex-associated protein alpha chain n=1 Tax=Tachysurus fulvidraco TaxID=1234273 RepID=UPI001FF019F5|nr:B-cell antigen receptor complex-associated protein alpha chain [Tachysurus fulvidraco]
MEAIFVLFCLLGAAANAGSTSKIKLHIESPSLRLAVSNKANVQCCYISQATLKVFWVRNVMDSFNTSVKIAVNGTDARVEIRSEKTGSDTVCSNLTLSDVVLNDTGLYQCILRHPDNTTVFTPGTYLQVYTPIQMNLHISEESKNSIITIQGVLLLLFVLIPGTFIICKSKGLHELEKRNNKEEENIYEGLNLDDCNSTYHQIQRSLVQGPYQDVLNNDEDDIQLEKP